MTSYKIPKKVMTVRVVRLIAILFLTYTGADLTVPEFCSEEMGIQRVRQVTASADTSAAVLVAGPTESRRDPPSEPTHSGEDCFCCCTHVLPGYATATAAVPDLYSAFAALRIIDVASPPLQGPYHPPRLA